MLTRVLRANLPQKDLRKLVLRRVLGIVCRHELDYLKLLINNLWFYDADGSTKLTKLYYDKRKFELLNKRRLLFW